jgi:hypothetical protein
MDSQNIIVENEIVETTKENNETTIKPQEPTNSDKILTIDSIMEREKQKNKNDIWSKIDKSLKIQKLHAYAEKYGKEHNHSVKDIKDLKMFFINALDKGKLQKTKDVIYDKEKREILNIPTLMFDSNNRNFTLKIVDVKRVSTLKSLTPKREVVIKENV